MRYLDSQTLDAILDFPQLLSSLQQALCADIEVPLRHHHKIAREKGEAIQLLMPAWTGKNWTNQNWASKNSNEKNSTTENSKEKSQKTQNAAIKNPSQKNIDFSQNHNQNSLSPPDSYLGVKIVNVFPQNGAFGLPSVMGIYVLMDGETGAPHMMMDGTRLTLWRTAACSALAAQFFAHPHAKTHLMVGAGALAPFFIRAHRVTRPIEQTFLWNHNLDKAENLAKTLAKEGIKVEVIKNLEDGVRQADIISTATLSQAPLIRGAWLKLGAHLDCVGAFTPAMRETDDDCVLRARLLVDTRSGALHEGGDFVQPLHAGLINESAIEGELAEYAQGHRFFQRQPDDITFYKSTGGALFDLACAICAAKNAESKL